MNKRPLLIFLIFFTGYFQSFAQVPEEYKDKLSEMLKLNGFEENFSTGIGQVVTLHKKNYQHKVPEKLWTEFTNEIKEASWPYLINELAAVYSNYYTISDLEEIIRFYQSPAGKKIMIHSEAITQESKVLVRELGSKIQKELNYKLRQYGYE